MREQNENLEAIAEDDEGSVEEELGDAGKPGTGGGDWVNPDIDP